jgi:hypothetical protein
MCETLESLTNMGAFEGTVANSHPRHIKKSLGTYKRKEMSLALFQWPLVAS